METDNGSGGSVFGIALRKRPDAFVRCVNRNIDHVEELFGQTSSQSLYLAFVREIQFVSMIHKSLVWNIHMEAFRSGKESKPVAWKMHLQNGSQVQVKVISDVWNQVLGEIVVFDVNIKAFLTVSDQLNFKKEKFIYSLPKELFALDVLGTKSSYVLSLCEQKIPK